MKLKTNVEINELARLNAWSDFRDFDCNCSLSSYEYEIYLKAFNNAFQMCQQDLLSQASEGYKEFIQDPERMNPLHDYNPLLSCWQASRLSMAKELEALKKENEELKKELLYSRRKLEERIEEAEEIIVSWNIYLEYLKRENELASKIGTVADDYIAKWSKEGV